ncbi:MAG: carboxyl transferase domain-containing protein [Thermoleophilia bacterium]
MQMRLAIVNRGEPARRLIRAARELNHERGWDITTIALHTAAERRATFVREADEAVRIGRPEGPNPYLDHAELERALRESHATAAWVGWGFVAEDPVFADLCARLGITFVGPPGEVMRALGDKISAKLMAESVGVPVAAWSGGPVTTDREAAEHAERIGYPLMIKAAAGGGGRGIRVVRGPGELSQALERARDEAVKAFGDGSLLMERQLTGARHVEVQIVADHHGHAWALGVRDCSVQRRNQKLLEESSSTALSPEQDELLRRSAVDLALAAGYRNAGTVEFLFQPADGSLAFLEVNTRLQVEHPVTETVTGADIVKLQLHVATGGTLEGAPPPARGHAIEARLNAEDPERGFAPAPGEVELFTLPTGPGIRVDTGICEGDTIPPEYDSMIAKVIAWGADRDEARARLVCALQSMDVVVRGGATNRAFLIDLLGRPEVMEGTADSGWLDRMVTEGMLQNPLHGDVALLTAAVEAVNQAERAERERFYTSARRGRPRTSGEMENTVQLRHRGQAYRLSVTRTGPTSYRVSAPEGQADVTVDRLARFTQRMHVGDRVHRVVSVFHAPDHLVEVDGVAHRVSLDEGGLVRAPAPAIVVSVPVAVGDVVRAGDAVVVLESMKMESAVEAPFDGVVTEVLVAGSVQVDAGAPLVRLEGTDTAESAVPAGERVHLGGSMAPGLATDPRLRLHRVFSAIRSLLLGFDITAGEARTLASELQRLRADLPPGDPELVRNELDALQTFTDLSELSRDRPPTGELDASEEHVHSPREHFHWYLRSLDAEREGVPAPLRRALRRALAHYGVTDDAPSPEVASAAHRMYLAQERVRIQMPVITALLDVRARNVAALPPPLRKELYATLDRLVVATQLRHPAVGELARGVRYAAFDLPLITAARARVWRGVRDRLTELESTPAELREPVVQELVASPQPLMGLLGERLADGVQAEEPMLEVLTRRHYKIRDLSPLRRLDRDGFQVLAGDYTRRERRVHLVSTVTDDARLPQALDAVGAVAAELSDGQDVVADVYVRWSGERDPERAAQAIGELIESASLPPSVLRLAVSIAAPDGWWHHFTFRETGEGLAEERPARGLHPMIARRLRFWRLHNFEVSRLSSPVDTYLFAWTAPGDPSDERLVALAEVRHLTEVRDEAGELTSLPEVEHALTACLESIRRAQLGRPANRRLIANHVLMYVWPTVTLPLAELTGIARRLAPMTEGLGMEDVILCANMEGEGGAPPTEVSLSFSYRPGAGVTVGVDDRPPEALPLRDDYSAKVLNARRRGTVYPFELANLLSGVGGSFTELDFHEDGRLAPVLRPPGENRAGIVAGLASTPTDKHPEGMVRVVLIGDPTKSLGSVSEPECSRIVAAIDLAEDMGVPVEWFALSSGARISRDSGTENMDWVSRVLRRLITFTQAGGEVNVVVAGINVGAQPYWNAEATMLMHTRGILVMTPDSAMVLTGKQALDYSGGVSAEDNFGIGGYDRIMGPNGQAQYWAPHLAGACEVLFHHYQHTYVAPGEAGPRRAWSTDPLDRDVRPSPHSGEGSEFTLVGDIFSAESNPERKKPFDIRSLMRAVVDQDHEPLERWPEMLDADTVVVMDAHLGGYPVAVLGIESRPIPRRRFLPADGPDQWTAGTLFPLSSKKAARAINAASGNRPLVVLANLTGFDGSPESLRKCQLEYGAEIGRAVVNFRGPIVFCVVSRYHGGAFVVFSSALNDFMEVLAVEGSYASVIGGAPAAAVVFAGDVRARTDADERVVDAERRLAEADEGERAALRQELSDLRAAVRSEKLGEVAAEFDQIHSVERALRVGSVDAIIPAVELRPRLVDAVERGLQRWEAARVEAEAAANN